MSTMPYLLIRIYPKLRRELSLHVKKGSDVIIGLGGGSAIDAAKAIASGLAVNEPIWPYWIGVKELPEALPVISVTTTSGTGSHATMFSVITNDETLEKPGLGSECIYPKVAIVDPELMLTVPSRITAATGFDVLAHSIEAYTSTISTPLTDSFCEKAISLVAANLPEAINNGGSLEARTAMAQADTYAGFSITTAMITLCHAMSHVVCGIGNLVHGESLAAMTPATIRLSMNTKPEKYKKIGWLLAGEDTEPEGWSLDDTVKTVEEFIKKIGLNISLREQGLEESDFDRVVKETLGYMSGAAELDPKDGISEDDVMTVLKQSL